jgi:hypothetical protein
VQGCLPRARLPAQAGLGLLLLLLLELRVPIIARRDWRARGCSCALEPTADFCIRPVGWAAPARAAAPKPAGLAAAGLAATVDWYLDHADWLQSIRAKRYALDRLGKG